MCADLQSPQNYIWIFCSNRQSAFSISEEYMLHNTSLLISTPHRFISDNMEEQDE